MSIRMNKGGWLEVPLYRWADGKAATLCVEPKADRPIEIHLKDYFLTFVAEKDEAPFLHEKGTDSIQYRFSRLFGNFNEEKKIRGLLLDLEGPRFSLSPFPLHRQNRSLARYRRWPGDKNGGGAIGMVEFIPDECLSVTRLHDKLMKIELPQPPNANPRTETIEISKDPYISLSVEIFAHGLVIKCPEIPSLQVIHKSLASMTIESMSRPVWRILAEDIARSLHEHGIWPLSRKDDWFRKNVETGEPISISREERFLFEAMGSPNPIWWNSLECFAYFAEKSEIDRQEK